MRALMRSKGRDCHADGAIPQKAENPGAGGQDRIKRGLGGLHHQCMLSHTGGYAHSGTGGQLDYLTGAAMSKGGKAFICMTSSFIDKTGVRYSRVMPHFHGDIVTDPRSQAYYIVTGYGVVNLAGRSTWERAEMLISIARPDFREELIAAAGRQKIWCRSNKQKGCAYVLAKAMYRLGSEPRPYSGIA